MKFYSYKLPTTASLWPIREGLLVESNGGWGEIAPLPGFSKESLNTLSPEDPSIRFALASVSRPFDKSPLKIPLGLFEEPMPGFSTLKLKLGHLSADDAVKRVKPFVGFYRLRVDCNRKWPLEKALRFAKHFSPADFEYLEEPVASFVDLVRFSRETGFPIAVDESIGGPISEIPTLKALVVKPTIVGVLPKTELPIVLSSAFESSLGLLQIARLYRPGMLPAGLDTFRFFQEDLLNPPLQKENGFLTWAGCDGCPVDKTKLCPVL